jgi:flagellar FliL protein
MTEDSPVEEAAPPRSRKKLILVVGLLVLLLGGAGGAAWYIMDDGDETATQAKEAPPKPPVYLPLETFTVNLGHDAQFLQVDLTLQLADQAEIDVIKQHMPRVRSRLLALLANQDADELLDSGGKDRLAKAIMAEINQPFEPKSKEQKVIDVLFTSFVIQ